MSNVWPKMAFSFCDIKCLAQNEKDHVRVLSKGACLKNKRHSPPASFSDILHEPAFQASHQCACYRFGEAVEDSAE